MTNQTLICGLALIVIGVYGYLNGQHSADEDYAKQVEAQKLDSTIEPKMKDMKTALIPAVFGGLLIVCAVIVIVKPTLRKHIMHVAAMIGVLGLIGGFVPIIRSGDFDLGKAAIRNGLLMSIVCAVFIYLCVQSFIEARKARDASVPV